jgi:mono/diheme cytochrome c family protein
MYVAAQGGTWGLAAYMSKYMDSAMNPSRMATPNEYPIWASFYKDTFAPVQKAIMAQDWATFQKEYMAVIKNCNDCHAGTGYGFTKVGKQKAPADMGIDYKVKSKARWTF